MTLEEYEEFLEMQKDQKEEIEYDLFFQSRQEWLDKLLSYDYLDLETKKKILGL